RRRQLVEESLEPVEVGGVEGGGAGPELEADAVQTIRVASRDDHLGSLLAGAPGRLEPDAGAAADHHERLARAFGFPTHDAALASRTGRAQSRSGAGAIMGLLPERKAKRFHSRVDTLYLELALGDRFRLTHELVRSLARSRPLPLFVAVGSVG